MLKCLIDTKVNDIKNDLDKIMLEDLGWIEIVCNDEDFNVIEYQSYYLEKLEQYNISNDRKNNHSSKDNGVK